MSKYLNLPKSVITNQRLTKKLVYSQSHFTNKDKKLFDGIDSMYVHSILAIDSIGIRGYQDDTINYERIIVLDVNINNRNNIGQLTEKLHTIFPNPIILTLHYEQEIHISAAHKRISLNDKMKTVLTNMNHIRIDNINDYVDFLAQLDYRKVSNIDLNKFYSDFYNRLYLAHLKVMVDNPTFMYTEKIVNLIRVYIEKNNILRKKQNKMNKHIMMRDQMKLNMDIKTIEEEIKQLLSKIKEVQHG